MDSNSYADFRLDVVQHVEEHLRAAGRDASVRFFADGYTAGSEDEKQFIRQTNDKYGHHGVETLVGDFLLVSSNQGAGGYVCRFEVKYLFDEYTREGWDRVDLIVDENIRQGSRVNPSALSALDDYAAVKDKLILCLRNTAKTRVRYRDSVFQKYDDMAMILYAIVSDDGKGNRLIVPVPRETTASWGMEDDDILAAALLNTARVSPARLYLSYEDMVARDSVRGDFMNPLSPMRRIPDTPMGAVLTAIPNTDGAVALFYPGVMERLSQMAGGDYYVVFTAKDEAHIHLPGKATVKMMRDALRDTNQRFPADMLTVNIFFYDAKQKRLRKV